MTTIQTKAGEILLRRVLKESKSLIDTSGMYFLNSDTKIKLPEGSWEIVGPIFWETYSTESNPTGGGRELKFGFDPEPFVCEPSDIKDWSSKLMYEQRFISLIESKGEILFSNPMGERPIFEPITDNLREFYLEESEWQENERKLLKSEDKIIVILNRKQ